MPSSVTQVHTATNWCLQVWHHYSQSWQTSGPWSCSYEFVLGRMLAYIEYQHEKYYMVQHQVRMYSNEGDIIPMEIFQK